MHGQLFAIARNTFVESLRQPIFFILVMTAGIMQVFNTLLSAYSMGYTEKTEVSADNKLLLDMGLATVMVCATLLAAFVATSVVSREIENKTALTVISKPVGRPLFVLGKYLGIAAAILVASVIMLVFFLFAIRHAVMSTARDTVDGPVVLFGSTALLIAIGLGIWGNFFYGWVFPSTCIGALLPLMLLAYGLTLLISKDWQWQPIMTDIKPQIMIASGGVLLSLMVLTAIAVACSTRLGQVMTIVVAAGFFVLGLLSNHLLGRPAFDNRPLGEVASVQAERLDTQQMDKAGNFITITLKKPPSPEFKPGQQLYYGPNPNGVGMVVPLQGKFEGDPANGEQVFSAKSTPAIVVRDAKPDGVTYVLVNVNNHPVQRPPEAGDHIFTRPTGGSVPARAAWSVIPNLQFFWMVDAVTQGNPISFRYLGLLAMYSLAQIIAFLSFGVLLFQRRDVG
ncbi:MAG: ABC transporter permease [Phycisphaerales bacterium]